MKMREGEYWDRLIVELLLIFTTLLKQQDS